jgi:hypothetical protein
VVKLPQLTKEELREVDIRELQYKASVLEDKLRASHPTTKSSRIKTEVDHMNCGNLGTSISCALI